MSDISYTQEYLLCALSPKGRISLMNSNRIITCLVASGLLELLYSGTISIDAKKKVAVVKELAEDKMYLKPLYDTINSGKRMSVTDIAGKYVFATSRRIDEFIQALGEPMQNQHCVSAKTGGLFHNKTLLIPDSGEVLKVVEKLRAEFLEDGAADDEAVILGALLQKSDLIKNYFSKFESQKLKIRIEEIKKSEAGSFIKEMVEYIDTMIAAIIAASSTGI